MRFALFGAVLFPAVLAVAQPKSADDWYTEGENQYNLGNFDAAAEAFKQGFAMESNEAKKPAYLFNVAQAYRQGNKCKEAAFFYKRYLSMKEQDTVKPLAPAKKAEIEQHVTELEACAKTQEDIAKKPPNDILHPDGRGPGTGTPTGKPTGTPTGTPTGKPTGTPTGTQTVTATGSGSGSATGKQVADIGITGGTGGSNEEDHEVREPGAPPSLLAARFTGGASKISAGSLSVPVQATFSLFGGYPLMLMPELELDVGGQLTFTPVPWTNSFTGAKKTGSFTSVMADAGATYTVAPKIGVRGDLGLGALVFGGISEAGNPFTMNGASTTGALTTFAVRAAVSADYAITDNIMATVTPFAFTYSPAKTGLRDDIKSLTRIDFMLGVGYRM
jgi:hypothetical protein